MKLHERIREFCNGRTDCQSMPWMFPTSIREMALLADELEKLNSVKAERDAALAVVEAARNHDCTSNEVAQGDSGPCSICDAICAFDAVGKEASK